MSTLTFQQRQALNPSATIWVTASAGSGKTKVLTDRLLSLMLSGTPPERILCLTFTKAAAAEMATRLEVRLKAWALADETGIDSDLRDLNLSPSPALCLRARTLFHQFLDTPGGFKIQTLHGFCQSLLSRFPLEAGVSPHFRVIDELTAKTLKAQAQDQVFERADQGDPVLQPSLALLTAHFSESHLRELLEAYGQGSLSFRALCQQPESLEEMLQTLKTLFSPQNMASPSFSWPPGGAESFEQICDALEEGSASEKHTRLLLIGALKGPEAEALSSLQALCCTKTGEPRKRLLPATLAKKHPAFVASLREVQEELSAYLDSLKTRHVKEISTALLHLYGAVSQAYSHLKMEQAALDYDDLIAGTLRLLTSPQGVQWILYKLDSGLDHVLIDEAQDTSPEQWQVIQGLADAFFETPESRKTLFIVGDPKQSIYSFQGADPDAFAFMGKHIERRLSWSKRSFELVSLEMSFRSSPAVLQLVDHVFQEGAPALQGVSETGLTHTPFHVNLPGLIELWPLVKRSPQEGSGVWTMPLETPRIQDPESLLAQGIAQKISAWIQDQSFQPKDILILLRKRGQLMERLVRALKAYDVPVSGVDRMRLGSVLPVLDLLALACFCLLPRDDLNLAAVLKGPLIGMSEEDLFALSFNRHHRSLWSRLQDAQNQKEIFDQAVRFLRALLSKDSQGPFAFFSHLLNQLEGRRIMAERLGADAQDALHELLSLSLLYEQSNPPHLQGFVHWLSKNNPEIKRDPESAQENRVRILTVHGAKGLEAPVVILPDTVQTPSVSPDLLWLQAGTLPCFCPPQAQMPDILKTAHAQVAQKQQEEYNRLLYVALTRAKQCLYVCGWTHRDGHSDNSWYGHVERGLQKHPESVSFNFDPVLWDGKGRRLIFGQTEERSPSFSTPPRNEKLSVPFWLSENPPAEYDAPVRTPSLQAEEGSSERGLKRGETLHKLLETLIPLAPSNRRSFGKQFLEKIGADPDETRAWLREVCSLLERPDLAWIWDSEGQSEVHVQGSVEGERMSGIMDRLLVTDSYVTIVDFKTDREPPRHLPAAYQKQLQVYAELLKPLYLQTIRACVLWTVTGETTWVSL
jgi:ATP-dependent helicase/nuclease subunit A